MKISGKFFPWLTFVVVLGAFLSLSQNGFGGDIFRDNPAIVAGGKAIPEAAQLAATNPRDNYSRGRSSVAKKSATNGKSAQDFLDEKFYEKPADSIRVATMNCYNYLTENRYINGRYVYDAPKPLRERQALHRIVKLVSPDVLLLQEIGTEEYVKQFADDLKKIGEVFPYTAFMEGRDTHRRLAILSKIPPDEILKYPMKGKMTRGVLGVRIKTAGAAKNSCVEIFAVHLKSRITRNSSDPECRKERRFEAECVRSILAGRNTGWIVGGDFNDTPDSDTIPVFLRGGFAKRLDARDIYGDAWTFRDKRRIYEHIFDHILVSPKIYRFYVPASARIVEPKISEEASDHRVVFADFCFNR
ncbi:MAG: endonuclease/exonuclease/phosphatase family protein [Opitutae bacterium]|nr:endonuclease/exonuclease/phosphatase family protein [Opitutae bacterium]MCD8298902.1 endonuclease/exonuclease/phosphatase family protein [Opitutae bacterium]